jgi:hypothetical protein
MLYFSIGATAMIVLTLTITVTVRVDVPSSGSTAEGQNIDPRLPPSS